MVEKKSAQNFLNDLKSMVAKEKIKEFGKFFISSDNKASEEIFVGVGLGQVFALANEFTGMPLEEIESLLDSPIHEARVGAVSIMDWETRNPNLPKTRRKELFDLYLRRHDRINDWDLVDRAAPNVVGGYLFDKPRDILYKLARSEDPWERRTAMASTYFFIREDDLDDTFKLAEILVNDPNEMVQKAMGGFLREAGRQNTQRLLDFLNRHADSMPKGMIKRATEHLDGELQDRYLSMKTSKE
jgi:3-methyladenine DNA glycosylase AlkD